ncbi:MAG: lasso peptide biosynthesis B2 protein [Ramlibacter sp.]|nr:lasso peptide biosynthesis B2 protein [Ramlibacter sp.]
MLNRSAHLLRRLLALTPRERATLYASTALLPLFWLALRALGLQRLHTLILRRPLLTMQQPAPAEDLARLVNTAARHVPFGANCLTRSLLLLWLLRRRGIAGDLRIGVRLEQGVLHAHAWVECDGVPVNDNPDVGRDFASFDQPIPAWAFQSR